MEEEDRHYRSGRATRERKEGGETWVRPRCKTQTTLPHS